MRTICSDDDMPNRSTVLRWLDAHADFAAKCAHARELQADVLAEQILEIADTPQLGEKRKTSANGDTETTEGDMIEHRRLQVETRKWLAARMAPKKYGEKQQIDANVSGGLTIEVVKFSDTK
jgi:hypothetical protein